MRSGHLRFAEGTEYSGFEEVFPALFDRFLTDTDQVPVEEGYHELLLSLNLEDIRANRKPEGYNRPGSFRMIFPLRPDGPPELIIYRNIRCIEVREVTEAASTLLREHGLEHEVTWDHMLRYEGKK